MATPRQLRTASHLRGFFVPMDRYDAKTIEQKWQRVWEDARAFYTPNPPAGEEPENHWYQLEMLPYPSGTLHMGHVLNYTMGDVLTHFRRRQGWMVMRPMGWDSFGCPRERRDPRGRPPEGDRRAEHQGDPRPDEADRWVIDWDREISAHHPGFYRWDPVAVPALLRARARLPQGGAGELVPERPDRGRQRVRDRRALRALRRAGRGPQSRAVVHEDHRLRGRAAPLRGRRLARADDDDPAQLDRSQRGRRAHLPRRGARPRPRGLHDTAGHAVRRNVLRRRARAPVRRGVRERRGQGVRAPHRRQARRGARDRGGEDRRLHRPLRDEPRQRRAPADLGRPTTC